MLLHQSSNALEIVNISNPATPTHAGKIYNGRASGKNSSNNEYTTVGTDTNGAALNQPTSVFVQGNYAYVVSSGSWPNYISTLQIVDISNPENPTHTGKIYHGRADGTHTSVGTDANGVVLTNPQSVFVQGDYAYITSQGSFSNPTNALQIVDISDPTNPKHAGKIYKGRTSGKDSSNNEYTTAADTNNDGMVDYRDNDGNGAALGSPASVFVQGNYAYVASQSSSALEIVNISEPTNPTHEGKIYDGRTSGKDGDDNEYTTSTFNVNGAAISYPLDVFVQGNYAYIASSASSALEIVNISNSTNPTHAGKIEHDTNGAVLSYPSSVFVQGNYAYVASQFSNALEIVNISNPASPTHAGKIIDGTGGAALNSPQSVFVKDNYAYVVSQSHALEIIELENTYTTSIPITRQVANNKAFNNYSATIKDAVGNTRNVSRTFTTITTDIPPLDITSYSDTANGARDGYINSEETTGNLITALGVRAGTAQYVVTTPTTNCNANALTYTTTIPTTTSLSTDATYKVCARVVNGTKTSYNHDILITKDTTAPSTTEDPTLTTANNKLTLTVKTNEEVSLDDITIGTQEPTNFLRNISHEGKITDGTGGAALSRPQSVFIQGDYAYIVSWTSNALEIVNISDPSSPTHTGKIIHGTNGAELSSPRSVFVQGDYAYIVSSDSNALEIVNISNPASPTHTGKITHRQGGAELNQPYSVFVQGDYAYIASRDSNALEIVNISNPASPTHTGKITNGTGGAALSSPISVFVQGNYAYVASRDSNALEIVNISNPATPTHTGKITNGTGGAALNQPISVFVKGNYAYIVSVGLNSLQIVDVSNPATPTHAGKIYNGRASGKDSNNNEYTTAGADTNGAVFNWPLSVFVQGNYAYVASRDSFSLQIVDVSDPENPTHAGKIYRGRTDGTATSAASSDGNGAALTRATSVFVKDNYAYVTAGTGYSDDSNALNIIELENTYTTEVTGTDTSSAYGVTAKDIAGNSIRLGTIKLVSTTAITLASNNANPRVASHTDKVTITIHRSEASETITAPTITVGGNSVTSTLTTTTRTGTGSRKAFEYEFTVTNTQNGEVLVTHDNYSQITALSRVVVDNTTPSVTGTPTLTTTNSDNTKAEIGDTVKLTVTTNEEVSISNANLSGETINFLRNVSHEGKITNGVGGASLNNPRSVFIQGDYAYVASASSHSLQIVNISNPANPIHKGKLYNGRASGKDNNGNEYTSTGSDPNGAALSSPDSVFVRGDYAYVASASSNALEIVNISDSTNPTHEGKLYNGRASGKDNNGNEYTSTGSDPNGAALSSPLSVFVQGNYAYVASQFSNALQVINISDPTNPTHAGKIGGGAFSVLNNPLSVFVQGDYAYVASSSSNALQVINISDPTTPTLTGTGRAILDTPNSVFVQGDYAYVVSIGSNTLEIIDISNPASPTHVGKIYRGHTDGIATSALNSDGNGAALNQPYSVFVQGDYAYIVSIGSNALEIVNISDPTNPTHAGKITHGTGGAALDSPQSVFVKDNYAYVASSGSNALEIIELENTYTASIPITRQVANNKAFNNYSATIKDAVGNTRNVSRTFTAITTDIPPLDITSYSDTANGARDGYINSEETTGNLITALGVRAGTAQYAVTTPTTNCNANALTYTTTIPTTTSLSTDTTYKVCARVVNGTKTSYNHDILITKDTTAPETTTFTLISSNSNNQQVATGDTITLTATSNEEISLNDITIGTQEPTNFLRNISHEGKITNGTGRAALVTPNSVFVQGDYAYIASRNSNALEIVNIANPTNPTHAGKIYRGRTDGTATSALSSDGNGASLSSPSSVFVQGNYAYITSQGSDALEIVNISNPANPTHAGKIIHGTGGAVLDYPSSVFVQGNYAYIVSESSYPNYNGTLEIVDISNPENPTHAGKIYRGRTDGTATSALSSDGTGAALSWPTSVFVRGDYAYIASNESHALEIVNISNPANPTHAGKIYRGRTDGTATSALSSDGNGAALGWPTSVFVQGDYAYITSQFSNALQIVNISDPTNPTHAGKITNGVGGAIA